MMLLMGLKNNDLPGLAKFTQNHYNITNGLCDILALQKHTEFTKKTLYDATDWFRS